MSGSKENQQTHTFTDTLLTRVNPGIPFIITTPINNPHSLTHSLSHSLPSYVPRAVVHSRESLYLVSTTENTCVCVCLVPQRHRPFARFSVSVHPTKKHIRNIRNIVQVWCKPTSSYGNVARQIFFANIDPPITQWLNVIVLELWHFCKDDKLRQIYFIRERKWTAIEINGHLLFWQIV